jgi:hypothetical protein
MPAKPLDDLGTLVDGVVVDDGVRKLAGWHIGLRIASAIRCVVSPGGPESANCTTRPTLPAPSGGMRGGRVLSRSKPSS